MAGVSLFRRGISSLALIAVLAAGLVVVAPAQQPADAADLTAFDPGMIISDEVFYSPGTMSVAAIQAFMVAKAPGCHDYLYPGSTTKMMCIQTYKAAMPARDANANCSAITANPSMTSAAILYTVANACGINPQVLLVLLQKEEDLILAAHSEDRYKIAAGYGCPDTAACATKYYGYANQLYNAAKSFNQWHLPITRQYMPGKVNTIKYNPKATCGTASVFIKNYATAALYMYTPYVPNSAALAAGYGVGNSCSAYGNRNFFNYFADWFGNPGNLLKNASFVKGATGWRSGSTGTIAIAAAKSAVEAQSASFYLTVKAPAAGRRLEQGIARRTAPGEMYTASIYVKSTSATPVSGKLWLIADGGTRELASVDFTADNTAWLPVTLNLAINNSGHTSLRFDVQLDTPNVTVQVDSAAVFLAYRQASRASSALEEFRVGSGTNHGWVLNQSATSVSLKPVTTGALSGKYRTALKPLKAGAYISQTIVRSSRPGFSYTFGVWIKPATPTTSYSGSLTLSALGGVREDQSTPFTVTGSAWQYRSVTLDVANSGHTQFRVAIADGTVGQTLYFDAASFGPNLIAPGSSFEVDPVRPLPIADGTVITRVPVTDSTPPAIDGTSVLLMQKTLDNPSIVQLGATRKLGLNETFRYEVWVRSATPGVPYSGVLSLEGFQSLTVNEVATQPFTATDEWQLVTVSYTTSINGLTQLMANVQLDTAGAEVYLDAARVR